MDTTTGMLMNDIKIKFEELEQLVKNRVPTKLVYEMKIQKVQLLKVLLDGLISEIEGEYEAQIKKE